MRAIPTLFSTAVVAAVLSAGVIARAQEKAEEDVQALIKEITALVERRVNARIAKLEQTIAERDKKIAELEGKLKESAAPKAAPAPPAPAGSRPLLGVAHDDLPADLKAKLKVENGALVARVFEGSPAAAAGIVTGDVLVSINGQTVSSATLADTVRTFQPGQEVNLVYYHDGNKVTKAVKLGDQAKFDVTAQKPKEEPKKEPIKLGVEIEEKDGALVVTDVEAGLTGSVAGVAKDDKITHVNGKDVKTIEDIQGELKKVLQGDKLNVQFTRSSEKEDTFYTANVVGSASKEGVQLIGREQKKVAKEPKPGEKKKGVLGIAVIPDPQGVLIHAVEPETAAASRGVAKGDVLKKVNDKDIAEVEHLKEALSKLGAGDKLTLILLRGGQQIEIKDLVLAAEGEKVKEVAKAEPVKEAPKEAAKETPKPADTTPAKKKGKLLIRAGNHKDTGRPEVTEVTPEGPGAKAGILIGDVILKVGDKNIASQDDLAAALASHFAGDKVTIRVKRGTEEKDVEVTLTDKG